MEFKIRPLAVPDIFTVIGMMRKAARVELAVAIKAGGKSNPTELGIGFFLSLFVEAEEELKAWLADLSGMDKDAFNSLSPADFVRVVRALIKQKGFKDFLAQVKELWTEAMA